MPNDPIDLSGYYDVDDKFEKVSVVPNSKGKEWYIERATKQILTRDEVVNSLKDTNSKKCVQKIYKGITGKEISKSEARDIRDRAGGLTRDSSNNLYNKEQIKNVISQIFQEKVTDERIDNIYGTTKEEVKIRVAKRREYIRGLYHQIDNNDTWGKLWETNDVDRYRYVIEGNSVAIKTNKQKYVDLSGYVWDDGVSGKSSVRDNVYQSNDKLVGKDDVTVKLKYNDGTQDIVVATTKTTSDGNYKLKLLN